MFSDDSSVPSLGHLNDLTGDEVRIITRQKAMIPGRWFGCPRRWNGAVLTVVDRSPLLSLSDEGSEEAACQWACSICSYFPKRTFWISFELARAKWSQCRPHDCNSSSSAFASFRSR